METSSEQKSSKPEERCVLVCQHTSCLAAGSAAVLAAFKAAEPNGFTVTGTGCQGQCSSGPTVRIVPEETWYCLVQPSDVPIIVEQHLKGGQQVAAKLHPRIHMRFSF
ncbi:MAG TPA: (2Fe-2S) ferredoxin domain-containing protein [Candidatus Sericytochromatia bacterium]|nr:(2Fe-2S) ferredoxin domain-containing protein [Cyanobacteriota bacterium]